MSTYLDTYKFCLDTHLLDYNFEYAFQASNCIIQMQTVMYVGKKCSLVQYYAEE